MQQHTALRTRRRFLSLLMLLVLVFSQAPIQCVMAQTEGETNLPRESGTSLRAKQARLSDRYDRLELLAGRLAELSRSTQPRRAQLLRELITKSRERDVAGRFDMIIAALQSDSLGKATKGQGELQTDLQKMLNLLLQEDRDQQIESERKRIKKYLGEVKRLIQLQRGIKARTDGGDDAEQLKQNQQKLAEATKNLADEIKASEGTESESDESSESSSKSSQPGQEGKDPAGGKSEQKSGEKQNSGEEKSGDQKSDDEKSDDEKSSDKKSDEKPGEKLGEKSGDKSDDKKPGDKNPEDESQQAKPSGGDKPSAESQPSPDGKPSDSPPSESQGSSSPPSPPPSPSGESSPAEQPPKSPAERAEQRLEKAQQRMEQALEKLEEAKRDQAVERQEEALRELEQAKAELERILRQLREEELERMLVQLEARFRKMLDGQVAVYEETKKIAASLATAPEHEIEIAAGRLDRKERAIIREADRALVLLYEDGTTVAFPEAIEQARDDMRDVAKRLGEVKIGTLTQGIEEDIIAALEETLAALQQAIKEAREQKSQQQQQQQQSQGKPGEQPLVDQLAELRMIRSLQNRINRSTERYGKILEGKPALEADLIEMLGKLSLRQERVFRALRDLDSGRNK